MKACVVVASVLALSQPTEAKELPAGFVHLSAVAPTIAQDMRYASARNFVGRPLPGYKAPSCILARPVAEALKRVQTTLAERGLSLKVFDCYRPRDAVAAMLDWAKRPDDPASRSHHPRIARSQLVPSGYISPVSAHSQGTAVDLTIVQMGDEGRTRAEAPASTVSAKCTEPVRSEGGWTGEELDMGTSYDCFDVLSHSASTAVAAEARANRKVRVPGRGVRGEAAAFVGGRP